MCASFNEPSELHKNDHEPKGSSSTDAACASPDRDSLAALLAGAPSMPESDSAVRARLLRNVTAGAAHDIVNLLCLFGFSLNVLEAEPLSPKATQALDSLRSESAYLRGLAMELQLATRDAQAPSVLDQTRLTAWWPDARTLLRAVAGDNALLSADIPWGLPSVGIGMQNLTQIVMNLVGNAAHAIADARAAAAAELPGVRFRPGQIAIVAVLSGKLAPTVRLSIADNGAGMSADVLAQVFEPAYTTRADRGGTGLGLAMTRRLVAEAGGQVSIASTPGSGTTVTLELPTRAMSQHVARKLAAV